MIILIATLSAGVAYVIANNFFGGISQQEAKVQTIDVISETIEEPSTKIFNAEAINPAVEVQLNNQGQNISDTDTSQ